MFKNGLCIKFYAHIYAYIICITIYDKNNVPELALLRAMDKNAE